MSKTRARRDEPPPASDAVVVRGILGESGLDVADLRANAVMNHDLYGFYGISVWVTSPDFPLVVLERTKLAKFDLYAVLTVADLVDRGLEMWPTGRQPHYDLVHGDGAELDNLVRSLTGALIEIRANPQVDREDS